MNTSCQYGKGVADMYGGQPTYVKRFSRSSLINELATCVTACVGVSNLCFSPSLLLMDTYKRRIPGFCDMANTEDIRVNLLQLRTQLIACRSLQIGWERGPRHHTRREQSDEGCSLLRCDVHRAKNASEIIHPLPFVGRFGLLGIVTCGIPD